MGASYGDPGRIVRVTPEGAITEFTGGMTEDAGPLGITAGPDGNVWFTEFKGDAVGRITPEGEVTEFQLGISTASEPQDITAGPDGNLWFTELAGPGGVITPRASSPTFSVLAVLPLVFLTELGFMIAFGVLLDTFIVRSVLVPALGARHRSQGVAAVQARARRVGCAP